MSPRRLRPAATPSIYSPLRDREDSPTSLPRSSGILLHPTSLPGTHGIGSLGLHAHRFAAALEEMHQSWWQMLPVGPTGYGDSPYQSPSTFAGNPLLVSFELLCRDGLLLPEEIEPAPAFPSRTIDFGSVIPWRKGRLRRATATFARRRSARLAAEYQEFCDRHEKVWLGDFALYTALKRRRGLTPWWEWERPLVARRPGALRRATADLGDDIEAVRIEQFLFDHQFRALRAVCRDHGVGLIGDVPIFVAHDSADVWAHQDLFFLDDDGKPTVVAGVPPDYFSETGQRWGNPLYDWGRHAADGFAWWTARVGRSLEMFDLVRIDHFRGFAASWHIPAAEETAVVGKWVEAPGEALFDRLLEVYGALPVIAEDLGVITPDVEELRDRYGFPGMKVLQFGFGTESAHALEEFRPHVVAYPGTHDNDTAAGWFADPAEHRLPEREEALRVLPEKGEAFSWRLLTAVQESVAGVAVSPLQDLLGLGSEARMNVPGTTSGNWRWRFTWDQLTPGIVERMRRVTDQAGRSPR